MPNWCSNRLLVEGDSIQLRRFIDLTINPNESGPCPEFTFKNLLPCPEELERENSPARFDGDENDKKAKKEWEDHKANLVKKYGYADWYDWRVENWGTKWDAGECEIKEQEKNRFEVNFDTAWAPPMEFFRNISGSFPDLKFSLLYYEPGMNFSGIFIIEDREEENTEGEIDDYDEFQNQIFA